MLILANLEDAIGAAVILNGVTIYHEDDDDGHYQSFDAAMVASRLSEALKLKVFNIDLTIKECGGDEWNFDRVNTVAVKKHYSQVVVQVPVELQAKRDPITDRLLWGVKWEAAEDAAKACKARKLTAAQVYGKAFAVYINGLLADMNNKDHKEIVTTIINEVDLRSRLKK
jgi:hypothetical protein